MGKVVHIVFSKSGEGSFKHSINIKKSIVGDKVIALYDDISNGYIKERIETQDREKWVKMLNTDDVNKYEFSINYDEFYTDISKINDNDTVYLWYGQCNREICGMLYTLYILKDRNLNVYSVNVSDMLLKVNEGVVWVRSASEIVPEKLGEYLKIAKKIEGNEYKDLLIQWSGLVEENSLLRSYEDGKMESFSEDYFDKDILKYVDKEYRNVGRTVGSVIGNSDVRSEDNYIFWRIKEMIDLGMISYEGEFGIMQKMKIRITKKGMEYLSKFQEAIDFWNKRIEYDKRHLDFINGIKEEGRLEERIKIAKNLLGLLDLEIIADKTGLTIGQLKNL